MVQFKITSKLLTIFFGVDEERITINRAIGCSGASSSGASLIGCLCTEITEISYGSGALYKRHGFYGSST